MSTIEKLINKLRNIKQPVVPLSDVIKVLDYYKFSYVMKKGSHMLVKHVYLIGKPGFSANGEFHVPTVSGRRVKKYVVKNLFTAIDIIEERKET